MDLGKNALKSRMIACNEMIGWIHQGTWKMDNPMMDGYVVNNHGDRKSPNWGHSPGKWPWKWLIKGGYYLLPKWDDPPSTVSCFCLINLKYSKLSIV